MTPEQRKAMEMALEALEFIPQSGSMLGFQAEAKRLQAIAALKNVAIEQKLSKSCQCGKQTTAWCMANTCNKASITALRQALEQDHIPDAKKMVEQQPADDSEARYKSVIDDVRKLWNDKRKREQQPAVQDSTCNKTLLAQGKAYPRTCKKCGLGPCIGETKQPADEPVAKYIAEGSEGSLVQLYEDVKIGTNFYTRPQTIVERAEEAFDAAKQREWVGLTDDEILVKCESVPDYDIGNHDLIQFARDIEQRLQEKNT